jgi:hypothetical protein
MHHVVWYIFSDVSEDLTASSISVTSHTYQTTWLSISEDSHLHIVSIFIPKNEDSMLLQNVSM